MTLSLSVLAGLSALAIFDLAMRLIAFRRFESIAIDVALFATAYSAVEFVHAYNRNQNARVVTTLMKRHEKYFGVEGVICGIIVILLMAFHAYLRDQIDSQVEALLNNRTTLSSPARSVIKRSVLVTFTGPHFPPIFRSGKRNWRTDVAEYLNSVVKPTPSTSEPPAQTQPRGRRSVHTPAPSVTGPRTHTPAPAAFAEMDFLLPASLRIPSLAMFLVLGSVAFATPAVTPTASRHAGSTAGRAEVTRHVTHVACSDDRLGPVFCRRVVIVARSTWHHRMSTAGSEEGSA